MRALTCPGSDSNIACDVNGLPISITLFPADVTVGGSISPIVSRFTGLTLLSFVGTAIATKLIARMSLQTFRMLLNALLLVVAISLISQAVAAWT